MSGESLIQVIEQEDWEPVVCPFCGFVAYPGADEEDWIFDPQTCVCDHTLFVATDAGFDYRSRAFNASMGLADGRHSEDCLRPEQATNIDAYTSTVSIPGSVKFAAYAPAPSFFGIYYGFAPSAESEGVPEPS